MVLPKLDIPTFEATLPVSEKVVKYRPFLVKEHKVLMMIQSDDVEDINKLVIDLVNACTFNTVDGEKLSNIDLEYLFLKIRSKSLGETYDFMVKCNSCDKDIETQANIENIKVVKSEEHAFKFLLTDTVGIEMKHPTFKDVFSVYRKQTTETVFEMIKSCVKAIYTPESYVEITVDNYDELETFIDSLTKEQFTKIENFFTTMPSLVQEMDVKCPSCGADNHIEIKGLENFFG
jgi:hypothetical protein